MLQIITGYTSIFSKVVPVPILIFLFLFEKELLKLLYSCQHDQAQSAIILLKEFFIVPNWTWLQCPLCTVLKSTSSISVALPLSSSFPVCMYVKLSCKSGDYCFNELFKRIGCNPNITRTFTNSYPTHD
jgi:hypothetical protein